MIESAKQTKKKAKIYFKCTNLKSKNKLDWSTSGNDAVTGMVDKQEVQDPQQSHESCRKTT